MNLSKPYFLTIGLPDETNNMSYDVNNTTHNNNNTTISEMNLNKKKQKQKKNVEDALEDNTWSNKKGTAGDKDWTSNEKLKKGKNNQDPVVQARFSDDHASRSSQSNSDNPKGRIIP